MTTQLTSPQEHTLERLLGYASEELLPGSFYNQEEENLSFNSSYKSGIGYYIGKIETYLNSFFSLMLPSLVTGKQLNRDETSLLKEKFEKEFLSQFFPRLYEILHMNTPEVINIISEKDLINTRKFEKRIEEGYYDFLKKYENSANTDYVTGLALRHVFEEQLNTKIKESATIHKRHDDQTGYFTLVYIDLNNLGVVNNKYGHAVGDAYLRAVSNKIKEIMRDEDLVARIGGDELTVICNDVNPEIIAKKIADHYNEICDYANEEIKKVAAKEGRKYEEKVMISVGLASSNGIASAEEIKRRADSALYLSKAISKFQELEKAVGGESFYRFTLLNCFPSISIKNQPSPEQIVQIYNPDYDSVEEGVKGVGGVVYEEALNLLPRKK